MPLHPAVLAVIRQMADKFPIPRGAAGTIDDACRRWTKRVCEAVALAFPQGMPGIGGEFGWKRASATRPESKETLALRVGNAQLHGWDLLVGVGTGAPRLSDDPSYHDLVAEGNQVFIPVSPFDWLRFKTDHAPLPTPFYAMSAFDLCCRIAEGDLRYLDEVVAPSGLIPRIVVASVFRTPRTNEEGRRQLAVGLAELAKRGLQAEITLLVDTKEHGISRGDALVHVTACNMILLAHPDAVAAVRIGNENSHHVEAAYMTDFDFLMEAASRIDRRFPLSFGAGHGGEGVLGGGSYASHHSNRSLRPDENGRVMAAAQAAYGVPVVDAEPLGITEPDRVAGRQRTSDPEYAFALATAAIDRNLSGATLHLDSGIGCNIAEHGDVHREALRLFTTTLNIIPKELPVTPEQVAQVFAGAFFERISSLMRLQGTVEARRPLVHGWIKDRATTIDALYREIFKRPCDLEGYGSRVLLYLEGWTDARLKAALQADYDAGAR